MTDQERQKHHDDANRIAEEYWPKIKDKLVQAENIKPHWRPTPEGEKLTLSKAEERDKKRLSAEAKEIQDQAMKKIEREVIDKLPPHATAQDKQLIRDGACDILGIPPDKRGQEDKSKGADATRETPASLNVSQSKFVDYTSKDAQNPGVESSKFVKKAVGIGGPGGGTPPTTSGPTKDER